MVAVETGKERCHTGDLGGHPAGLEDTRGVVTINRKGEGVCDGDGEGVHGPVHVGSESHRLILANEEPLRGETKHFVHGSLSTGSPEFSCCLVGHAPSVIGKNLSSRAVSTAQ